MKFPKFATALSCVFFMAIAAPNNASATDDSECSRYLFAYFEGSGEGRLQEHLRFAISRDAVNWRALNDNLPVIASDSIAKTKGIRDPHILRGENGDYYIVATDMNTIRDGWSENPGIVLMRSTDLVHWTHSYIDLPRKYSAFSDAYWVWAPQVIYDEAAGKYMIYFTLQRTGDGRSTLITYYAYANAAFTAFEQAPKQLFAAKYGSIDNDIIKGPDGLWHLFYKGNTKDSGGREIKNGIQQAVSENLTGPYTEDFIYLDAYANNSTVVEGSSTFKLIGQQKYILMYDLYSAGRYEYQTSTDLMSWTQTPRSFTKDFMPRHGSVIPITLDEAKRLAEAFPSTDIDSLLTDGPWVEPEDTSGELLVSYSFDRDGDDSGTYAATLKGSAQFVTLDGGNRVLSTGNDAGYLDLGTSMARNVLGQLTNNYTISLDINIGARNSLGSYCWAWALGNGTGQYTALVNRAGNANWYYEVKNSTAYVASSAKGLDEDEWHTVTAVQKGNTCAIYIDGEKRGTCITTLRPADFAASITQSWLGRSPYSADAYMTNTLMDNFRIYSKALTAAQVKELYNSRPQQEERAQTFPVIFDFTTEKDTQGQFTGTLENGATLTTFASTPVLDLGQTDGYFDFGPEFSQVVNSLDDQFTISTTLYIPQTTSISGAGNFIWCFAKSSSQGYIFLSAKDTRYAITKTSYGNESSVSPHEPLQQGRWVNVTYIQNGSTGTLYVDGEVKRQKDNIELHPAALSKLVNNWLGRSCYSGDVYLKDALYADFRIYNTAISSTQLAELTAQADALNNLPADESIRLDLDALSLPNSINNLYEGVTLPTQGTYGSAISWKSSDPTLLSDNGKVVGTPTETRQNVTLTATLSATVPRGEGSDPLTATKTFDVYVHKKDSPYSHYLFTFFPSNSDENIYYAVSDNGYDYTTINEGQPVVKAADITVMGGLRDPHILRGEDGRFYMVATDMRSALGWSSNRGMVLMRSDDLINWQTSTVHFPTRYAGTYFANVTRVWAPETIYDPVAGKYMIYFSILTNDGKVPYDKVFYAYANEDFTDLEGTPTYFYDRGSATIDMNIVYNENDCLYHAVYKNEGSGGICQVTATTLTPPDGAPEGSQWSAPSGTLQQTTEAVEGAGIFRLIDSDDWILMYDCYSNGHYQFCSSPDLVNFTFRKNTATSGSFTPRHGTVIPITESEYQLLLKLPYTTGINNLPNARSKAACSDQSASSYNKVLHGSQIVITPAHGSSAAAYDISGRRIK